MNETDTENNLEIDDFPYICRICLFKGDTKPFNQGLKEIFTSIINIIVSITTKCKQHKYESYFRLRMMMSFLKTYVLHVLFG